jgi:hypothetical protein
LPPEAHFVSGVGFTYYGRHVAVGFDFGLHDYHYAFVHVNNFCDYAPYRYVVPHNQVQGFYRNTTVINNYVVRNNNQVINQGIGRETIARASQTRVREVSIRETQVNRMENIHGDRIEKEGNRTVVYRPQLPKTPPTVRSAQFASRSAGAAQPANAGRVPNAGAANITGPTHGGSSRGESGVAARSSGNENVDAARPQPQANQERNQATPATRGTGNNIERGNQPRSTSPAPAPARPQAQPRSSGPLFGTGAANNGAQPQNNVAARPAVPRTTAPVSHAQPQPQQEQPQASRVQPQSQPQAQRPTQPNYSRGMPVYPGPQTQEPPARVEHQGNGPALTPRQQEQQPRYSAPPHQAPAPYTPRYSNPSERQPVRQAEPVRQSPVVSGGNQNVSRGEAAASRAAGNR